MLLKNKPDTILDGEAVRDLLQQVTDPEIPVLTLEDLGVLRDVAYEDGRLVVTITPTYSGCPAMRVMEEDIRRVLSAHGIRNAEIRTRLAPAWTTDWISDAGRAKLRAYGIAPPPGPAPGPVSASALRPRVQCPRCGSIDTERLSEFGSTACKALYRCRSCLEPFDHFKRL